MTSTVRRDIPMSQRVGHLRFALGELTLFVRRIAVCVPVSNHRDLEPGSLAPEIVFGRLRAPTRAIYLPGWPIRAPLPAVSMSPDYIRYVSMQCPRYYVDLTGTFDDYLQSNFSPKSRYKLRRKL